MGRGVRAVPPAVRLASRRQCRIPRRKKKTLPARVERGRCAPSDPRVPSDRLARPVPLGRAHVPPVFFACGPALSTCARCAASLCTGRVVAYTRWSAEVPVFSPTTTAPRKFLECDFAAIEQRIVSWLCGCTGGHDDLIVREHGRMFLRCTKCQRETPGWTVTGRRRTLF